MRSIFYMFIYFALFFWLINSKIVAQDFTTSVKGRVIDKDSKQALVGVNIVLPNTTPITGTTTDEQGNFQLSNLKPGRLDLRISHVGYEEVFINQLLVGTGKQTALQIELQEKVQQINEVVVRAENDKTRPNNTFTVVSARSFSVEEAKRYAGTLNDPSRMVQSFAGVVSANDENNAIVVRGNSPRGLLWRMEGIEIPNPNHFAGSEGSTGGGVSILSANMLANTDFYSGAFPAEFGNALSGVFDLNLRKGNNDKWEHTVQIGVLGLEAAVEGPFSKKYKGSYLVNYRYSTLDILSLMGIKFGNNQVPKYQDLAFNFSFPTKRIGHFTAFGLGGLSSLGSLAKRDVAQWKTFEARTDKSLGQMMGAVGITHQYHFSDNKTLLKTVVSLSASSNGFKADTLSNDYIPGNIEQNKFTYIHVRTHSYINRKVDAKNSVRTGLLYQNIRYHLFKDEFDFAQRVLARKINTTGNTHLLQGYWQWKHRFTDNFNIVSGIHFTYSAINKKFYAEPRISSEWRFKENMTLSAGAGLHSRMDPISTYESQLDATQVTHLYQNRTLDFTRAFHAVMGYRYNFLRDFCLKTEVYCQYLFTVPVGVDSQEYFSIINLNDGFVNFPLVNKGNALNYGIELTTEKFFSHNYYFLYTLSLFNSQYTGSDRLWRHSVFNTNYVMNLLGGKEFILGKRKINRLGVNARLLWRGGLRETPIDLKRSNQSGVAIYDHARENSIKLPDYFRVDAGLNFRRNKRKWSWILALDIQNVINRQNIAKRIYNRETRQIEDINNIGIIPVLSWKAEF